MRRYVTRSSEAEGSVAPAILQLEMELQIFVLPKATQREGIGILVSHFRLKNSIF